MADFRCKKGFLRRIHRWPLLIPPESANSTPPTGRKRVKSLSSRFPPSIPGVTDLTPASGQNLLRGRASYTAPLNTSISPDNATSAPPTPRGQTGPRPRRASAAEKVLEQVRSRDQQYTTGSSPRTSWLHQPNESPTNTLPGILATSSTPVESSPSSSKFGSVESRRFSAIFASPLPNISSSPKMGQAMLAPMRPRLSRSPSAPAVHQHTESEGAPIPLSYPPQLLPLLDGEHHTDELAVMFNAGWPRLEQWLIAAGGGTAENTFGRISMIFR